MPCVRCDEYREKLAAARQECHDNPPESAQSRRACMTARAWRNALAAHVCPNNVIIICSTCPARVHATSPEVAQWDESGTHWMCPKCQMVSGLYDTIGGVREKDWGFAMSHLPEDDNDLSPDR